MNDFQEMMAAYVEGKLNATQVAELEAWMREDPDRSKAFVLQAMLDCHLAELLHERNVHDVAADLSDDSNFGSLMQELEAPEGAAGPVHFTEVIQRHRHEQAEDPGSLSAHDLAVVGGYVLRKFFINKKVITTGVCSAAAAILLLTLILVTPFAGDAPGLVGLNTDIPTTAVATITAQHEATWSNASHAVGKQLWPGQRLTLIDGFAEITTDEGAAAILEAPCTIAFTSQANTIQLEWGKLVGKCPTRQSKGFTVLTPNAQVIDLGTEFGVEVEGTGETSVFVFDGLVALAGPDDDLRTAELTEIAAGQGKRVDRAGQITAIDPTPMGRVFVRSVDPDTRYEQMVLADKPLVYYRMDQFIGGVARNLAADRYHAKVFGDSETVTDGLGSSLSLGSFGDYLQTLEPLVELRGAASYTIDCWVKPSRHDFGLICLIGAKNTETDVGVDTAARLETTEPLGQIGTQKRFRFVHANTPDANLPGAGRDGLKELFSRTEHRLNRWIHVAAVNDAGTLFLYIDGVRVSEGSVETGLLDQEQLLTIGRFSTADIDLSAQTRQFLGELDELAIYDHALSPDAVRARHEAGQFWLADE
ncbi:MAG: FecR domain-containing protein [Phycisphaeraceae bacterium]|nr:FecR domain-containing protein [Phycisphaeraceae bacterium]